MNSTTAATATQLEDDNRKLILALRAEIDVLRGTQTATNAVVHALLATHAEPHHCHTAIAQIMQQLAGQSQGWPERSRQAIDSTFAALRTTLDRNQQNREAHRAKAAN